MEIGSRSVREYDKIEATKEYIVSCLKAFGYVPSFQTFTYSGKKYSNIIASRKGAKLPDETVIIGAHYDTAYGTPGADDNASAVAILLEIARALKDFSPDRTLKLIFFVVEEPPIFRSEQMGSYVYAKEAKARNENITSMICLEMLGYYTNEKDGQTYPFPMMSRFYPSTPNFICHSRQSKFEKSRWKGQEFPEGRFPYPRRNIVCAQFCSRCRFFRPPILLENGVSCRHGNRYRLLQKSELPHGNGHH